jgi:hypothetical protein
VVAWSAALFLVVRLVQIAAVAVAAAGGSTPVLDLLTKADGQSYLALAANGYPAPPPIGPDGVYVHTTDLAFFGLYPLLVRVGSLLLDPRAAAVVVSLLAGTAAAAMIGLWAAPRLGRWGAVATVAVWSLWPSGIVLGMGYSESLFLACAAATLLALQRGRWLAAGLACALGGLTRPTGAALVVAVVVAVVLAGRPDGRRWAALVIAPLGLVVSIGHVALATGRWDGWFWLQRTVWKSGFDGGVSTWRSGLAALRGGAVAPYVVSAVVVILFLALLVVYLVGRPPWHEAAYVLVVAAMGLGGVGYFHCKPRFLLPAFPVMAVVGGRWARWRVPVAVLVGVAALVASTWWNTYLVVSWPYSL